MNPIAGWYDDPSSASLARYWDGEMWTVYTHPKLPPAARRESRPPLYLLGATLLLLGIVTGILASLATPSYSAVRVTMTVLEPLTIAQCDAGKPLRVAFEWGGKPRTEDYYLTECTRDYELGASLTGFAASNDPSNLGPTDRWILHPDEHDPFDAFGPDAAQALLTLAALALGLSGVATLVVGLTRSRRNRQ